MIRRSLEAVLRAMNHDFCPGANQYVYWMKKPVGWVVAGTVFSALVGYFIGPQGYILMWALLALLLLGVVWPWLSMKGLSCKLFFQQSRTHEGETCKVILEVTNRWPVPAFGLMLSGNFLQELESEEDLVAVGLKRVPAWSVSRFEWPVKPERRGKLPGEIPELTNGFPFGLYTASKPIEIEGTTIVWPGYKKLEGTPDLGGLQFNIAGLASDRAGNEGETIGVRDYRHGDPIKNIQWVHTARCNRLIVRERQSLSQMPIKIIVDLTPANHTGRGSQSTYEWAIRLAGSICRKLHVHQSRIELICLGLPQDVHSRTCNRKGLRGVLDFLALLPEMQAVDVKSNQGLSTAPAISAQNQFVIFIHTDAFQGSIQSSKLIQQICIDEDRIEAFDFDGVFGAKWKSESGDPKSNTIPTDSPVAPSSPAAPNGSEWSSSHWEGAVNAAG